MHECSYYFRCFLTLVKLSTIPGNAGGNCQKSFENRKKMSLASQILKKNLDEPTSTANQRLLGYPVREFALFVDVLRTCK